MILLFVLAISLVGITIFSKNLREAEAKAIQLSLIAVETPAELPVISVIIPAYNEAENIEACLTSVLRSSDLTAEKLEVWVVDDQSIDETAAIVQTLQQSLNDPRLKLLAGQPRPTNEVWVGKNWACAQVIAHTKGDFLLFLDADVRLKPNAIATAVGFAETAQIDLLTIWMTIVCGCFAEWLAQPIIASLFATGFDFAAVNNPDSETAFAVGPFMLFRRSAYDQIGGHFSVASEVVEDVELGRRIKQHGLKLWYGLGHDLAEVRMYRSFAALWEGWTKNWYVGSRRNLRSTLYTALITFLIFTVPWIGLLITFAEITRSSFSGLDFAALCLSLTAIVMQYNLRCVSQKLSNIPPRYWWLSGLGGLLVSAIAIASIIKTETGWGWTWRGRNLAG